MTAFKKHNFSAGPGILPKEVCAEAAQACIDWQGSGLSILEVSHRGKAFVGVMDEAMQKVKDLLKLNDDWAVIYLGGGASTQFFQIPMNLLPQDGTACYVDTGVWASKAIKEAKAFGNVEVLASSKQDNYTYIPKDWKANPKAAYLHITSNNTIYGTEYHFWPERTVPIVCDMSSDIFSRPVPIDNFDLIYAGAQKNMGPAGVTMVALKKELLGKVQRHIPSMCDYRLHIENESMYNTPPVFPVYVTLLTLRWVEAMGGVTAMEKRNIEKASLLYQEIDRNPCFFGTVRTEDRSRMNVCFKPQNDAWEKPFMELAKSAGCEGLAGHRSVGGFRASLYNALELESVQALVQVMQDFALKYA